ncbi:MAG: CotH kinase family protein, partial [Myxococcota bacterium]|nr:CotH kinase family protein [Myxococcota bacterium]
MWHGREPRGMCTVLALATLCACGNRGQLVMDEGASADGNFNPDHVVQVAITMADADWEVLRNETRTFLTELGGDCMSGPFEHDYTTFSADIDVDGQVLSNIGVRKKGFIGSQSTTKPGLKINLDEYVDGVELFGTDNMTLNNAVQDPALIRQCLTYGVFAAAGVPSPRCNFARVSVNGADLGIYAHVEPVKRSFLRDHFGSDDGDLYEGTLSDFQQDWYRTFDPKNSDTDESLSGIVALMDTLDELWDSDESVEDALEPHLDVDQYLSHMAMETIAGHWDGYSGSNHNNFYIYDDPATDTFV